MPALLSKNMHRHLLKSYYYLAITLSDIITRVKMKEAFRFGLFLIVCLFTTFIAQNTGFVIAAAMSMRNNKLKATFMPVMLLFTSGSNISNHVYATFGRWIAYLSYRRYGYEATVLSIYRWESNETMLKILGMSEASIGPDIAAVVGIFLVMRILGYISLNVYLWSSKKNPASGLNWI